MRIRLLSDLHLEHTAWIAPPAEQDIVVLAGDIHNGSAGVEWAAQQFDAPVLYVPGNHEYYGFDMPQLQARWSDGSLPPNVQVLDDGATEVGDVRFLGTTLWTDFALHGDVNQAVDIAARRIQDYVRIRYDGALLSPLYTLAMHRAALEWLRERLQEPYNGKTIVVSHHCAHPNTIAERYADSPANPSIASDLTELILSHDISAWLCGHTHASFDFYVGSTRLICNPRGYTLDDAPENSDFNPTLVIEI